MRVYSTTNDGWSKNEEKQLLYSCQRIIPETTTDDCCLAGKTLCKRVNYCYFVQKVENRHFKKYRIGKKDGSLTQITQALIRL